MTVPGTTTPLQMKPELMQDLERFRAETARLRTEIGDVPGAIAQLMRKYVDPEDFAAWENNEDDDWLNGW